MLKPIGVRCCLTVATALFSVVTNLALAADTPIISVGDSTLVRPVAGSAEMEFDVSRNGDVTYPVTVGFQTGDDTARAGTDYSATRGFLKIPSGATRATIRVPISPGLGAAAKDLRIELTGASGPLDTTTDPAEGRMPPAPVAMVTADFNADGRPDLAAANRHDDGSGVRNSITVLINVTTPDSTAPRFSSQSNFGIGGAPISMAVADLNDDGRPDLITANGDSISILINSMAAGAEYPTFLDAIELSPGLSPCSIEAADFNGDKKLDLISKNCGAEVRSTASILLNSTTASGGEVTFRKPQNIQFRADLQSVIAVPRIGGLADLVVTYGGVNGYGELYANTTHAEDTVVGLVGVDLFGNGGLGRILAVDLSGDGRLEFLAELDRNDGNDTPLVAGVFFVDDRTADYVSANQFEISPTFTGLPKLLAADFDGDGKLDVATVSDYKLSVLRNTTLAGASRPRLANRTVFSTGIDVSGNAVVADFNGDARPDIASAGFDGRIRFVLNESSGDKPGIQFAASLGNAVGNAPQSSTSADFDGDGRLDIAAAMADGSISILINLTPRGEPTPVFAPRVNFLAGVDPPRGLTGGDFNRDGRIDLAIVSEAGLVSVLLNTTPPGSAIPSFGSAQRFSSGLEPVAIVAGDFNGDGRPDLAVANQGVISQQPYGISYENYNLAILLNSTQSGASTAAFKERTEFSDLLFAPSGFFATDLNGDGKPDLVITTHCFSRFCGNGVFFEMNRTGAAAETASFAAEDSYFAGTGPLSAISVQFAGDPNGDGRPDLFVSGGASGSTQPGLYFNTTSPGAGHPSFSGPATDSPEIAFGSSDFNGDGKVDEVFVDTDYDVVFVLTGAHLPAHLGRAEGIGTILPNADATPDPFSFTGVRGVPIGSVQTSNAITISGINEPATVSVTGGTYSISCNDNFTNISTTLKNGQKVCVRHTASASFSSTTTTTLSIGGIRGTFASTTITEPSDATPNAFRFVDRTDVPRGVTQASNSVTIRGINAPAQATVTGGSYSINDGAFGSESKRVKNGDRIRVRHSSSERFNTAVNTRLTIGGVSDTFTSTTLAADTTPDAFDFVNRSGVKLKASVVSNTVTISGLSNGVTTSLRLINGGGGDASFSINGQPFAKGSGKVRNADKVRLRNQIVSGTSASATINIGGITDGWRVSAQP